MRGLDKSPQSLATPAFAGFPLIAEGGTKAALTTGMTTDRKIFDFPSRRGIMAEIEYPGVAQLVGRDIWDVEVGCSSHLTRTKIPLKSTISEGFSYWIWKPPALPVEAPRKSFSFKHRAKRATSRSLDKRISHK